MLNFTFRVRGRRKKFHSTLCNLLNCFVCGIICQLFQTSSTSDLVEDGSAVAFLQQNGQTLSTILDKTSGQRREEMEIIILAAFSQLQTLDLTGVDISVMMEYAGILGDMQNIFLQNINTASTFDIARVCCRSLKLSKENNQQSNFVLRKATLRLC